MKIKIKDLKPNPFRDTSNYPMNEEKVRMLAESIKQTGFWDNILARKQNGSFQIAYGHHRLAAIREIMKPTDEVDIPIKELSDALMIKIMANENMDEWKTTPQVIDETVRVTKQFLEAHPEETIKVVPTGTTPGFVGKSAIARFLNWNEHRVSYSLERLHLIEDKIIDAEAIKSLPTERSARDFVKAVKETNLPLNKQRAAVEKILDGNRGEQAVKDAVLGEKYTTPKKKQEYRSEKIIKYESYVAGIRNDVDGLFEDLKDLVKLEKEIGDIGNNVYRSLLMMSLSTLSKQIEIIIKNKDNDETKSSNANLRSTTN